MIKFAYAVTLEISEKSYCAFFCNKGTLSNQLCCFLFKVWQVKEEKRMHSALAGGHFRQKVFLFFIPKSWNMSNKDTLQEHAGKFFCIKKNIFNTVNKIVLLSTFFNALWMLSVQSTWGNKKVYFKRAMKKKGGEIEGCISCEQEKRNEKV